MACAEHVDLQLRSSVESHLQSISGTAKRMVSMTTSALLATEVSVYTELQREIHYALRAQHPEWVQPNGESPTCDSYESRFAELLRILPRAPVTKNAPRFAIHAVQLPTLLRTSSKSKPKQSAPEIAI